MANGYDKRAAPDKRLATDEQPQQPGDDRDTYQKMSRDRWFLNESFHAQGNDFVLRIIAGALQRIATAMEEQNLIEATNVAATAAAAANREVWVNPPRARIAKKATKKKSKKRKTPKAR